jgi:methylmalonyl-CoA epimerase
MAAEKGAIKRVHHVGVAVRDLEAGLRFYGDALGLPLVERELLPELGVEVALLKLENAAIELIRPLAEGNSVARFIERRGEGLHHLCFETPDIEREMTLLRERGVELIDQRPRRGVAGRVCFLHPRAHAGVLVELVEVEA